MNLGARDSQPRFLLLSDKALTIIAALEIWIEGRFLISLFVKLNRSATIKIKVKDLN